MEEVDGGLIIWVGEVGSHFMKVIFIIVKDIKKDVGLGIGERDNSIVLHGVNMSNGGQIFLWIIVACMIGFLIGCIGIEGKVMQGLF